MSDRLALPMRWSLLGLSATEPLMVALLFGANTDADTAAGVAALVVSLPHTVLCVALLRSGIAQLTGAQRPGRRLLVAAGAATAVAVAVPVAFVTDDVRTDRGVTEFGVVVGILFAAAYLAALTPLLGSRWLMLAVLVPTLALIPFGGADARPDGQPSFAALYAISTGLVALVYRPSVWSLSLIFQIERSRETKARLAVAEERLRFARDLHDVLGRNLALIAVKSELAAHMLRLGKPGAAEHLLEARQVAQDSMREMRAVVGGYRTADLDTELEGARSVLASAGVSARVIGDSAGLPSEVQVALGWVVREAVTNIIRHSDAATAIIELSRRSTPGGPGTAVMLIRNDGRRQRDSFATPGTGLTGLQERLAAIGAQLVVTDSGEDGFVLEARVPISPSTAPITPSATSARATR